MDLLLKAGMSGGTGVYNPSSYFTGGTAGPWFDFGNSANVLNGSSVSAANGETVGTVNDSGTAAINASQATDANRPILRTAHVNGRNAVECASDDFMDATGLNAFSNGASSYTICAVFRPTDGTANHCAWRCFDNSFSYDRVNALFVALKPSIKYSRDGGDYANLRTGASDATAATYHAIIWVIDCTNGQTGIYMDNATYLSVAAAGGTTVAGAMTATNANESRIIRTSVGFWADLYIHKNSLMDSTQRTNWFSAVKSRFALSTY